MKNKIYLLIIIFTLLLSLNANIIFAQSSTAGNNLSGSAPNPVEYLGSSNGYNVEFKANGTLRGIILQSNGHWGIGLASPSYLLDIKGGDVNIDDASHGRTTSYRIGGDPVLWHNGDPTSIFVGAGAGSSIPASSTLYNTLVGNNAGTSITSTAYNTLIGTDAGQGLIDNTDPNVAVGYQALYSNQHWGMNTALGYQALYSLNSGCCDCINNSNLNTAVGYKALYTSQAYGGCALGFWAGYSNTHGCSLIAIGEQAAYSNTDGNDNVAIGESALVNNADLSNNVAIGTHALETQYYTASASCGVDQCGHTAYGCVSSYNVAVGNHALFTTSPTSLTSTTLNDGAYNTAVGDHSFFLNSTGYNNAGLGYQVFYSNNLGYNNVGLGYQAGYSNQRGIDNVSIGYQAGYSSDINYALAMGWHAGYSNTGGYNSFLGTSAGSSNTTGSYNTCVGYDALYSNTTGYYNSGLGLQALGQATTGNYNTGVGYQAGYAITTGSKNIFVGHTANAGGGTISNSAAYGYATTVNANNTYLFGNAAVGTIGGPVNWSIISDGRFKTNITENVRGLEFINLLRPITYKLNAMGLDSFVTQNRPQTTDSLGYPATNNPLDYTQASNIIHSGFIAQEVELASQQSGFNSSIVNAPPNNSTPYSMNYAEIVVPLVKAVQQLDSAKHAMQTQIDSLIEVVGNSQPQQMHQQPGDNGEGNNGSTENSIGYSASINVTLSSKTIVLNQNVPNPFKEETTIEYFIPDDAQQVKIIFTDNRGSVLKEVEITEKGKGQLNVYAADLSSGIYRYTIVADGVTIDTKQMVKTK